MISLLDSNKSVVPVILNLHKNDISNHLADIFNIWLYTGLFPTILKVAKVLACIKKISKFDFPNYQPIPLLSNMEKNIREIDAQQSLQFLY